MDLVAPQLFDESTKFSSDSVLGSKYFDPEFLFEKEAGFFQTIWNFITDPNTIATYKFIIFALAIFFIAVIIYSLIRIFEIRKKEHAHVHHEIAEYAHKHAQKEKSIATDDSVSKNPRWVGVLHLLFSTSTNDWKLAVIEADSMLESLLTDLGYKGESFGDKLKDAGLRDFKPLNSAWEVHNIRNRIAHEGSIFELSHHEAKRVIAIYGQIFREFGYV